MKSKIKNISSIDDWLLTNNFQLIRNEEPRRIYQKDIFIRNEKSIFEVSLSFNCDTSGNKLIYGTSVDFANIRIFFKDKWYYIDEHLKYNLIPLVPTYISIPSFVINEIAINMLKTNLLLIDNFAIPIVEDFNG